MDLQNVRPVEKETAEAIEDVDGIGPLPYLGVRNRGYELSAICPRAAVNVQYARASAVV